MLPVAAAAYGKRENVLQCLNQAYGHDVKVRFQIYSEKMYVLTIHFKLINYTVGACQNHKSEEVKNCNTKNYVKGEKRVHKTLRTLRIRNYNKKTRNK